jgi:dihydroxyacetone kinase
VGFVVRVVEEETPATDGRPPAGMEQGQDPTNGFEKERPMIILVANLGSTSFNRLYRPAPT